MLMQREHEKAEGTYLGSRQGTYGIQHQIRDDAGDVTVLNSSGHLNFLLENHVSKGDFIQVTYKGTEELKKGKFKGKEMHQFEVAVDDERGRDASAAVVESGSSSTEAAAGDDDDDTGEDETEEGEEAEEAAAEAEVTPKRAAPAAKPAAPAKAPTVAPAAAAAKTKMSSDELLAKYRKPKGA